MGKKLPIEFSSHNTARECRAEPSELLDVATSQKEAPRDQKMSRGCLTLSGLWRPLPLFGRTCWTWLNQPDTVAPWRKWLKIYFY